MQAFIICLSILSNLLTEWIEYIFEGSFILNALQFYQRNLNYQQVKKQKSHGIRPSLVHSLRRQSQKNR